MKNIIEQTRSIFRYKNTFSLDLFGTFVLKQIQQQRGARTARQSGGE